MAVNLFYSPLHLGTGCDHDPLVVQTDSSGPSRKNPVGQEKRVLSWALFPSAEMVRCVSFDCKSGHSV